MLNLAYPASGENDPTAADFLSFCRYSARAELS